MKKRTVSLLVIALVLLVVVLPAMWIALRARFPQDAAERYLAYVKTEEGLGKYRPPDGFVPDKETAIAIAVAVWKPIYGRERIERQAPYRANLVDGIWVVSGTLPGLSPGGTAKALIKQDTGEILQIIHEQ